MTSSDDVFYFGMTPVLSGHGNDTHSLETHSDGGQTFEEMDVGPAFLPPSPSAHSSGHLPDVVMDNRTSQNDLEDDELVSEDELFGGISLPIESIEVNGTIHSSLAEPGPSLTSPWQWQPPTALQTTAPPSETSYQSPPNPFDSSMSTLSLQGTDSPYIPGTNQTWLSLHAAMGIPPNVSLQQALATISDSNFLQHLHNLGFDETEDELPSIGDFQGKNDFCKFIQRWAEAGGLQCGLDMILRGWDRPDSITRDDLQGDRFDMQGINWEKLDTTRAKARVARLRLCSKKTNTQRATTLPNSENYFRFGKMNTTHRALISHFQLRNLISCTSRNDIYYASKTSTATKVIHTDASGRSVSCAMDLTSACGDSLNSFGFSITALTASEDVLIAGGFNGEYALTHLSSTFNTPPTAGFVTHEHNGIQNHIHTFSSRSSGKPQGVFCSNDRRLRVLDCDTNQFTYDFAYEQAINCSATSPDGRMRVIVGDFNETLITNAEAGVTFERLRTHTDHVFACAWADDGIHLATGAQDSRIVIWDARRWDHPLITIESEMACPRSLCFSPVGGGKRVLFAAEAQDFVNVIDAVTFDKRQVLDFYGEIGGMTVTPDGSSLFVANCDSKFGGIMEFERVGYGEQHGLTGDMWRHHPNVRVRRDEPWEWVPEHELDDHPLVILPAKARRRRGLGLGDFVI